MTIDWMAIAQRVDVRIGGFSVVSVVVQLLDVPAGYPSAPSVELQIALATWERAEEVPDEPNLVGTLVYRSAGERVATAPNQTKQVALYRGPLWVQTEEDALEFVRACVRVSVLHELDEALLVDGLRRWDPHRGGARGLRPEDLWRYGGR
jgi:hypothetical protein